MDFIGLKQRLWWACDDGTNAEDMEVFLPTMDGALINEAIRSLADCLFITQKTSTLVPNSAGVVTLPSDLMEVQRVRYKDSDLTPITNTYDIPATNYEDDTEDFDETSTVSKYMVTGKNTVQLYDAPPEVPTGLTVTPTGTPGVTTWGYQVSATTAAGTSIVCAEVKTTTGASTLSGTNYNALAWTTVSGATEYNIYRTTGSSTGFLATTTTNSYNDDGTDTPTTVSMGNYKMHIWYRAYPATLVNATDTPSEVPIEYHEDIADVYGRAMFARKLGDFKLYRELMSQWMVIKKELRGIMDVRVSPVDSAPNKWAW